MKLNKDHEGALCNLNFLVENVFYRHHYSATENSGMLAAMASEETIKH